MTEPWGFWLAQLAGKEPETTPGTPHWGFYLVRERRSWPNPLPEVGGPRRKTATHFWPCAIWHDESGWHCLINKAERTVHLTDVDAIDDVFSRCCRSPIAHDEYLKQTAKEPEHV